MDSRLIKQVAEISVNHDNQRVFEKCIRPPPTQFGSILYETTERVRDYIVNVRWSRSQDTADARLFCKYVVKLIDTGECWRLCLAFDTAAVDSVLPNCTDACSILINTRDTSYGDVTSRTTTIITCNTIAVFVVLIVIVLCYG